MELEEVFFALGGWIVATLVVLIRLRTDKRVRQEMGAFKEHMMRLIQATERQREPLNRLVALSKPGSEMHAEAVTALRIVGTAVEDVIRAKPELKPEGFTFSPATRAHDR